MGCWIRIAIILGVFINMSAFAQTPLLSPRGFAEEVAKVIRAEAPSARIEAVDDYELTVITAENRQLIFSLGNAYATYRKNPGDLMKIARMHLVSIAKPPAASNGLDRKRVIPVVKDREWLKDFEELQRRGGGKPQPPLFDELNAALIIAYAEDMPTRMRYLMASEFDAIGVERTKLLELAKKNLLPIMGKILIYAGEGYAMVSAGGGDYDASLLLFSDIWSGDQIKVEGEIVVAIPARDKLFVTGSRNTTRLAQTREAATKIVKESPYPLTDKLFVHRGGKFEVFPGQ